MHGHCRAKRSHKITTNIYLCVLGVYMCVVCVLCVHVYASCVLQDGWSPLHASSNGHLAVVEGLIEAGVNVNQCDMVGTHFISVHCKNIHAIQ